MNILAHDYIARANAHRPQSCNVMATEIRRLKNTGLTVRDISTALRLDLSVVLQAITEAAN